MNEDERRYVLGQSAAETERLNKQWRLLLSTIGSSSPILPPIERSEVTAVLDAGTGTGHFLSLVANECPSAELYGVDLSDSKFVKGLPERFHLSVHNLLEPFPEELGFKNKFDLISLSLVLMWLPTRMHRTILENLYTALKPGGWIQIIDCTAKPARWRPSDDPDVLTGQAAWNHLLQMQNEFVAEYGMYSNHQTPALLESVGFSSVSTKSDALFLFGNELPEEVSDLREFSSLVWRVGLDAMHAAGRMSSTPGTPIGTTGRVWPEHGTPEWADILNCYSKACMHGAASPFLLVYAQKPASTP